MKSPRLKVALRIAAGAMAAVFFSYGTIAITSPGYWRQGVAGIGFGLLLGIYAILGRTGSRVLDGRRELSAEEFGSSFGASSAMGRAVYRAAVQIGGDDLRKMRADDEFAPVFGVVDDDIEDIVITAGRMLGISKAALMERRGTMIRTPGDIVTMLAEVARGSRSESDSA